MKKRKIGFASLLVVLMLFLLPISASAHEGHSSTLGHINGFVEPETWGASFGTLENYTDSVNRDQASLPKTYDVTKKMSVPQIRNQGEYGTCWAHATIACLEFNMIKKGYAKNNINLSELQLSYYANYSMTDRLGLTKGESYKFEDSYGCYLCNGGNSTMSLQPLERGLQLADESKVSALQYSKASTYHPGSVYSGGIHSIKKLSSDLAYKAPSVRMVGYAEISKDDTTAIKNAIVKYGAVKASYNANSSYMTKDYTGFYCGDSVGTNHAVTLVGWDDSYSKSKLKNSKGQTPSKDGAWIVRNSWGSYNSKGGYFYLSYYDKSFNYPCVFEADRAVADNNVYMYDNTSIYDVRYSYSYNKVANVYKACASDASSEKIYAVSAYLYGSGTNGKVKLSVYTNLTNPKDPLSGTLATSVTVAQRNTYLGYVYSTLSKAVTVKKGTYFSIVAEPDSSAGILQIDGVKSSAGQSFEYYGGSLYDIGSTANTYKYNNKLNVYTKSVKSSSPTSYKITYNLNGGTNAKSNPSTYVKGVGVESFADATRSGYKFLGWYKDSAFKTKVTSISKTATGSITLYAKWQKKSAYSKNYVVGKATYTVKYSATDKVTDVIFTGYSDKTVTSLNIAAVKINGKTLYVTTIASKALMSFPSLTKVTIGSKVKTIGQYAFYNCKNLKSIEIKTPLLTEKTVGTNAFKSISANAVIKVPAKNYNDYCKLLKAKGVKGKNQKIVK